MVNTEFVKTCVLETRLTADDDESGGNAEQQSLWRQVMMIADCSRIGAKLE
jgi:hypothetical protein